MRLGEDALHRFLLNVNRTINLRIAEELRKHGIGGGKVSGGSVGGTIPAGVALVRVEKDGAAVGDFWRLNFVGTSWVVVPNATEAGTVDIGLANGGPVASGVVARSTGDDLTDRAGVLVIARYS